jgi:hypothetical protein
VNFLRISCARRNRLPVAGFQRSRKILFTAHGALCSPHIAQKFSADLTIAVLGNIAIWKYYPDTLFALADKKLTKAAQ